MGVVVGGGGLGQASGLVGWSQYGCSGDFSGTTEQGMKIHLLLETPPALRGEKKVRLRDLTVGQAQCWALERTDSQIRQGFCLQELKKSRREEDVNS